MKKELKIDFKQIAADPRVLVVIIVLACAALIGLCVYAANETKATEESIKKQVEAFENNKTAIENLLALKARSEQYMKQNEEYEALITSDGLNKQEFMVFFDNFANMYDCRLTLIEFDDALPENGIYSMTFRMTVEGDFENLMALCDGIVTQDRFYRIDAVTFAAGSGDFKSADITVAAFSKTENAVATEESAEVAE